MEKSVNQGTVQVRVERELVLELECTNITQRGGKHWEKPLLCSRQDNEKTQIGITLQISWCERKKITVKFLFFFYQDSHSSKCISERDCSNSTGSI